MSWACAEGRLDAKLWRLCTQAERDLAQLLRESLGRRARRGIGMFLWKMQRAKTCTCKQGAYLRVLALKHANRLPEDLVAQLRSTIFAQRVLADAMGAAADPEVREVCADELQRFAARAVQADAREEGHPAATKDRT